MFWPAGYANAMPVFAAKVPALKKYDQALDAGAKFRGKPVLGKNKTWRGVIFAFVSTIPLVYLQKYLYENKAFFAEHSLLNYSELNAIWWSALMTVGALGGDALKSFFKRQKEVSPGHTWFPFDQTDYVLGAMAISTLEILLPIERYLVFIVLGLLGHLLTVYIGFKLGLRERPI